MRPDTRKKLRAGYPLILLFAVLAAGIIATGYLSYRNYERRFRIETERQLSAIAELKVNELVRWRKERLGDAGILFKNASFSALVRNFFRRPADSESRGQLQVWLDNYRTHYEYDRIFLLDAQCVERMSAPQTPEPVAAHLLEQAPEILRSDRVTFLDFHRDSPDRPIHLSILIPILDGRDDRPALGILVLRIDPGKYLYPYISRWPAPSRSAETLLVRRDGNDALYLNELKFQKNTALNLRVPLTAIDVPAVKAALGREGIAEGVDYRGVRVAACVRAVPDSPWFLVDCMDTAEVYAPARERLWVTVGLVGALFLGAGAGVGLIWRHQRARFYRELYRTAEARRESEDKHRTLFETMAQGVVYQNAEGHIITANPAAERILGLTLDEMLGRKSTDPRWRAIHEDGSDFPGDTHPAMVALRTGKEVRNVIMGVSRFSNNEYVWININAIPQFRPGNTKPHQVFATFEDITERKKAETALAQSEQKLKDSHIKLRSLAEHLLHTREQERRNIAQEIHDDLGQVLTALKMDLRWMEKRLEPSQNRFQQKLREMIGLTDQTIEKVQRLSSQLRPRMLDDLGLTAAIEWLGADFSRRTRIRCKVTVELTESRIGGNSTTVIFRMVQEALTNVERHARASTAVVELREVQERIEIRVQDNGVGIAEGQADGPKSFGLIGIKERAQGLDGEVSIRGEPGKGTTVAISIPYPGGGALA